MKTAYSMLLGEYVSAPEVEHRDTTGFQIVCPCCKDAVLKVERQAGDRRSEFFSHHRSPADVVADCELRVQSISDEDKAARNSISRGQSIEAFRRVLRDALDLDAAAQVPQAEMAGYRERLAAPFEGLDGKVFETWANSIVSSIVGLDPEHASIAYELDLERAGIGLDTAFARKIQLRIATDLLKHVVQPHASKSFRALLGHVLVQYRRQVDDDMSRLETFQPDHAEHLTGIWRITNSLLDKRPYGFAQLLVKQHEAQSRGLEVTGMMSFSDMLSMQVIGSLLRLPYREMLVNHKAGRPMLDGVEFHPGLPLGTTRIGEADLRTPRGML